MADNGSSSFNISKNSISIVLGWGHAALITIGGLAGFGLWEAGKKVTADRFPPQKFSDSAELALAVTSVQVDDKVPVRVEVEVKQYGQWYVVASAETSEDKPFFSEKEKQKREAAAAKKNVPTP